MTLKLKRALWIYAVVGVLVAWPLMTGMIYQGQREWKEHTLGRQWEDERRQALGYSIIQAGLAVPFWPLGLPFVWLDTGFAECGVFRYQPCRGLRP